MNKSPGFQFYPDKFLAGTEHLSDAALTGYVRILCWMWLHGEQNCKISKEISAIRDATRFSIVKAKRVMAEIQKPHMSLLRVESKYYVSNGLRKEARKQEKRRRKAQASANARWKQCSGNANASSKQCFPSPSPIPSPTPSTKTPPPPTPAIPPDWQGDGDALEAKATELTPMVVAILSSRGEEERQRFFAVAGQKWKEEYERTGHTRAFAAAMQAFERALAGNGEIEHPTSYFLKLYEQERRK